MRLRVKANDPNAFYGQHLWKEILVDPNDLVGYVDPDATGSEDQAIIVESHRLARNLLTQRVSQLADKELTSHQLTVFKLWMENKTYQEIGEILKKNYSCSYSAYTAISHTLMGIKSKKHNTYHGGIKKKLKKLCSRDPQCRVILDAIHSLRQEDVDVSLEFLAVHDPWWKRFKKKYEEDHRE